MSHNFLKVFIYLSDVSEINGPHIYVENSHKDNNIGDELRYYNDSEITQSNNKIKYILGKKGSIFFEDTFGMHKGGIISHGYRLMLILTYYAPLKYQLKKHTHYLIG